jgi:tRNA (cmo5U34)-methyltransferase
MIASGGADRARDPYDRARMSRVEAHFDEESRVYDELIESVIPGYVEQNLALLDAIPLDAGGRFRAADLGIGTGSLAALVLERFPNADLVGYDISSGMLEKSAQALGAYGARVRLAREDLADVELAGPFELVISGLAIHHLEDRSKRDLFGRVLEALVPGGAFLVRDVVLGDTEEETARLYSEWRAFIRDNGLDDAEVLAAHEDEDLPAPLGAQLEWLREAGFEDVRVLWRRMSFAVFGGTAPAAGGATEGGAR